MNINIVSILLQIGLVVTGQCPTDCWCPSPQVANCTSRGLKEIPHGRFDRSVQQLDISDNVLITLDETSLQDVGLSSLEKLNASNNLINEIHERAFVRQSKLQRVDLSRNELVVIEPNTFKQNRFLETLSLANNENLKLPAEGSFLNSKSLTVLDLSACHLSNIPPNTFREAPNLEALYISHNKFKALPLLQSVKHLNILDVGYNYLTDLNCEVFSAYPKLSHLILRYNKLSTLNTTVTSQLANVSNPEDLKGNPWVCDCTLYTVYSWCSSHGVDLEIVCSGPAKCNDKLWNDCYKAGCDGNDTGVDQVAEMVTIGYIGVSSEWLEDHGNKIAPDSEEIALFDYTKQPSEGLENQGHQNVSESEEVTLFDYTKQPSDGLENQVHQNVSDSEEVTLFDYTKQPSEGLENQGHQNVSDSEEVTLFDYTKQSSDGLENQVHQNVSDSEEVTLFDYTKQPSEGLENQGHQNVSDSEEVTLFDYTKQPSEGLENQGHQNVSDSEEVTLFDYTKQPSEGLENQGHQNVSDSFGVEKQKQENIFIIIGYVCSVHIVLTLIVSLIVLPIMWHRSKSYRLRDTGRAKGDPEASRPLQNTEYCAVREEYQNSHYGECGGLEMTEHGQTRHQRKAYNLRPFRNHTL